MAQYMYKARDGRGELITGIVQAASVDAAGDMLRSEGKFITKLAEVNDADLDVETSSVQSIRGKVKRDDVISFAHQLSVMIDTGVPISEALDCVAEQSANPAFKAVLADVAEQVQAGGELSAALRRFPKVFPTVMISLVRASEVSGTMGRMLERVSSYLGKEQQTIRKIRGALTYPSVMLAMVISVTVFLLTFVLPRFAAIYETRDAILPMPTRILMAISGAMIDYWYLWLAGLAAIIGLIVFALRVPTGRRMLDYGKLHLPLIGPMFRKLYLTRACRTMGVMLSAGVPILDMIAIVRQVTVNAFFEDLWDEVDERLRQGAQLSDGLFTSSLVPRSVAQMVYSGEKSGRLGQVMETIAEYTEQEFDEQVKSTTQYIEPIMVSVMGGVIGFVAIALLLPIFKIGTVVQG